MHAEFRPDSRVRKLRPPGATHLGLQTHFAVMAMAFVTRLRLQRPACSEAWWSAGRFTLEDLPSHDALLCPSDVQ